MSSVVNLVILIVSQKLLAEGDQGDANVWISLQKYVMHVEGNLNQRKSDGFYHIAR